MKSNIVERKCDWFYFLGDSLKFGTDFLPFEEARNFVRNLKFKGCKEWHKYCGSGKKPNNIPSSPYKTYKGKGWKDYGDWLGTDKRKGGWFSFEEARKLARKSKLNNQKDWFEYCKSGNKPNNIPTCPHLAYKDKGWHSYGDWLGTENIAPRNKVFLSFKEARKFSHSLNLKGQKEWEKYRKSGNKPNTIPSSPNRTYKDKGWVNWADWLGYLK